MEFIEKKGVGRSQFAAVVIVALLVGVGIGWVVKPTPPSQAPERATLTVMSLWSGSEEESFKVVLTAFTDKTGIQVRHIPQTTEGLLVGVPTALLAQRTPADVVLAPWTSWIKDLAREGHLTVVTDSIARDDYSASHLDEVSVDGVIYAAPFKMAGKPGFWYKKSFFNKHGLSEPTTYEEFKTLLAKLKEIQGLEAPIASGDGVGWPLSDTTEAFIIGLGGAQLQLDLIAGRKSWTDPEVRRVLQELTALIRAGYFSTPDDWTSQVTKWWNERYGIYFMGDWIAGMKEQGVNPDDIDFFPFPGTNGVAGAIDYAFVPKYTGVPDQARELIRFLAAAEAQSIWAERGGYLAPNLKVDLNLYTPISRSVVEFLGSVRVVPDLDDAIGGEFQTTFWDQLKLLWVNPDTLSQVLTAIQAKAPKA